MRPVDILAFGAHPDDVELSCGGTLLVANAQGQSTGIVDLTYGELGTRGTKESRLVESTNAQHILGVAFGDIVGRPDGLSEDGMESMLAVMRAIRSARPQIVLANAIKDRHPDHPKAAKLVREAAFLSGLVKIETRDAEGNVQEAHRPRAVYHYIQSDYIEPTFVVNVSEFWEKKWEAIMAYSTQFHSLNAENKGFENSDKKTFISTPTFLEMLRGRHAEFGNLIGANYAEGFLSNRPIGLQNVLSLL